MLFDKFYKSVLLFGFFIIYLAFAKWGTFVSANLVVVLVPIVISVIGLTLLSPPVAVALVFMSHNLIGQITLSHPGFMIQVFPAIFLFVALLFVRRKEFRFKNVRNWRVETWALLAILFIFLIGFFRGIFSQVDEVSLQMITGLFKASNGGVLRYYPYVFLSRWGVFISLGALACRGEKELKIFMLAFAVSVISQLIAIPLSSYVWVLSDMCSSRLNYTGLQILNINRAYLGYLIACSSYVMLVFALKGSKGYFKYLFYFLALILLFLCIIAGSKGPVAAFLLVLGFLMIRGGKLVVYKLTAFLSLFLLLSILIPKIYGCIGGLEVIFKSSSTTAASSVSVRADLAKSEYSKLDYRNVFGKGLGASLTKIESFFIDPVYNKEIKLVSTSGSHNLILDFLVDLGVVGLAVFLLGVGALVACLFKKFPKTAEGYLIGTLIGGLLIILGVYSVLATDPSMATVQALFLGLMYGVNVKSGKISNE